MNRLSFILPLGVFVAVLAVFWVAFDLGDPNELPSPLVGKAFPEFSAPSLFVDEPAVETADLRGEATLVNVWATWCPTCLSEHETLMQIANTDMVRIVGVNYKDDRAKALQWLDRLCS